MHDKAFIPFNPNIEDDGMYYLSDMFSSQEPICPADLFYDGDAQLGALLDILYGTRCDELACFRVVLNARGIMFLLAATGWVPKALHRLRALQRELDELRAKC